MIKVLVLFTGGTIGSIRVRTSSINEPAEYQIMTRGMAREKGYDTTNSQTVLIDKYNKTYNNKDIDFDIVEIADVLSENMTLSKWNEITDMLRKIDFSKYYGVIITHGTDTLGYFANYMAMVFNDIDIPMVLVSSNYELEDQRANGLYNFQAACDFIKNVSLSGVYVMYRNTLANEKKTRVIYGSRLLQCASPSNDFESITVRGNIPLGQVDDNGKFEIIDRELYNSIDIKDRFNDRKNLINEFKTLNSKVLIVEPYVGLDYNAHNFKDFNAVLHTLYHSGTACIDNNMINNNIITFARNIKKTSSNVDIFAGPIYGREDSDLYATSHEMISAGIDLIMNTSKENAYIKLLLAYTIAKYRNINANQINDFVKNFMKNEYNNEFIQSSKSLVKKNSKL